MDLSQRLDALSATIDLSVEPIYSAKSMMRLIDLTLLDTHASHQAISELINKGNHYHTAAICILPTHLHCVTSHKSSLIATVLNFPGGDHSKHALSSTLKDIETHGLVDEIDYVFPYRAYLNQQQNDALNDLEFVLSWCRSRQMTLKVILEIGAFPSMESVYEASSAVLEVGCDFLKTSTGKIPVGATIPATFAMMMAILDGQYACGVKVSGGVKTFDEAYYYIRLAETCFKKNVSPDWFRIGASSLLNELIQMDLE